MFCAYEIAEYFYSVASIHVLLKGEIEAKVDVKLSWRQNISVTPKEKKILMMPTTTLTAFQRQTKTFEDLVWSSS